MLFLFLHKGYLLVTLMVVKVYLNALRVQLVGTRLSPDHRLNSRSPTTSQPSVLFEDLKLKALATPAQQFELLAALDHMPSESSSVAYATYVVSHIGDEQPQEAA